MLKFIEKLCYLVAIGDVFDVAIATAKGVSSKFRDLKLLLTSKDFYLETTDRLYPTYVHRFSLYR